MKSIAVISYCICLMVLVGCTKTEQAATAPKMTQTAAPAATVAAPVASSQPAGASAPASVTFIAAKVKNAKDVLGTPVVDALKLVYPDLKTADAPPADNAPYIGMVESADGPLAIIETGAVKSIKNCAALLIREESSADMGEGEQMVEWTARLVVFEKKDNKLSLRANQQLVEFNHSFSSREDTGSQLSLTSYKAAPEGAILEVRLYKSKGSDLGGSVQGLAALYALDETGFAEMLSLSDAYTASSSISYDRGKEDLREESTESLVQVGDKLNKGLFDLVVVTTTCKRSPEGRDAKASGTSYRFDGNRYLGEGPSKKRYEAKCD